MIEQRPFKNDGHRWECLYNPFSETPCTCDKAERDLAKMARWGLGSHGLYLRRRSEARFELPIRPDLAESFFRRMHAEGGVGLAAPQIDMPFRFAVIEYEGFRLVLNDPIVRSVGKAKLIETEGCLSLPGKQYRVERYYTVNTRVFLPGDGDLIVPLDIKAHGQLARIIQHEYDHLEGVLISDIGEEVTEVT